jgi:serine/threonine protein kinase
MTFAVNDVVGKYKIIAPAGGGNFGQVFAADNQNIGAKRAVKFIKADNAAAVPELLAEAKLLYASSNKHIVQVFDADVIDVLGQQYVAIEMEFLPDGSVQDRAVKYGIAVSDAVRAVRHLLFGLIAAHQANVIHRDIKPSNLLIKGNDYKLSDFGIAFLSAGNVAYEHIAYTMNAAPECLARKPATVQSDVYSAGMTLFRLMRLRGSLKVDGSSFDSWRSAGCKTGLPAFLGFADYWPLKLKRIVLKATQALPGSRYQSAQEMLADLDRVKDGLPWKIGADGRWSAQVGEKLHEAWFEKKGATFTALYKINGRRPSTYTETGGGAAKAKKAVEKLVSKTAVS